MDATNKKQLRKQVLELRSALSKDSVKAKSQRIAAQIFSTQAYQEAKRILIYLDFKNEVNTQPIIDHALGAGKAVFVPVVVQGENALKLVAYYGLKTPMTRSSFGILEPTITAGNTTAIDAIDLVLAPGVAFDLMGNRLGYGGGYYDRLLSTCQNPSIRVIALAFELQLVSEVPHEAWDMRIDALCTEDALYPIKG